MLFVQQWLTGKHIKRERVQRQAMIHKTLHRKKKLGNANRTKTQG